MTTTTPPIIWLADMPAGFHNPEPRRKIAGLEQAGHRVTFVEPIGVANPRPRNARKVARYAWGRLSRGAPHGSEGPPPVRLDLVPPRHHMVTDVINDRLVGRRLARIVASCPEAPVLWFRFPSPELVRQIGRLGERAVVYDCVDRYSAFGYPARATSALIDAEHRLLQRADLTLVTSHGLLDLVTPWTRRVVLHHNGVDVARFAGPLPLPDDLHGLERPLVGYAGALDEKLDYRLLARIAETHSVGSLVLIGPRAPGVDLSLLERLPKVHLLGSRPHAAIPAYLRAFDLGLMPYLASPVVDAAFPVKSLEYLAAGIPSVATEIRELRRFRDVVALAEDEDAFVRRVAEVLAEDAGSGVATRRAAAARFDWERQNLELQRLVAGIL